MKVGGGRIPLINIPLASLGDNNSLYDYHKQQIMTNPGELQTFGEQDPSEMKKIIDKYGTDSDGEDDLERSEGEFFLAENMTNPQPVRRSETFDKKKDVTFVSTLSRSEDFDILDQAKFSNRQRYEMKLTQMQEELDQGKMKESETVTIINQLKTEHLREREQFQQRIEGYESKMRDFRGEIEIKEDEKAALRNRITTKEEEIGMLYKDMEIQKKRYQEQRSEVDGEISKIKTECDQYKDKLRETEQELLRAQLERGEAKNQMESGFQIREKETSLFKQQAEDLKNSLEFQKTKFQSLEEEARVQFSDLKAAQALLKERSMRTEELEEKLNKAESAKESLSEEKNALELRLTDERSKLRQEIRAEFEIKIAQLEDIVKREQQHTDNAERLNRNLHDRVEELKGTIAGTEAENTSLREEIRHYKELNIVADSGKKNFEELLDKRLEEYQNENHDLQKQVWDRDSKMASLEVQLEQQLKEIEELKRTLVANTTRATTLSSEYLGSVEQLQKEKEVAKYRALAEYHNDERVRVQDRLMDDIDKLKQDYNQQLQSNLKVEAENTQLRYGKMYGLDSSDWLTAKERSENELFRDKIRSLREPSGSDIRKKAESYEPEEGELWQKYQQKLKLGF